MGFDADFVELLLMGVRVLVLTVPSRVMGFMIIDLLVPRKKSIMAPLCYMIFFKMIFVNIFFGIILNHYFGTNQSWRLGYVLLTYFSIFSTLAVLWHTYEGDMLKKSLVFLGDDVLVFFFEAPGMVVVNYLENRSSLFNYCVPAQKMDVWIPVINCAIFGIFYLLIGPYLRKFRDYEPKHRKFWWCVFGAFIFFSTASLFFSSLNEATVTLGLAASMLGIVFILVCIVDFQRRSRKLRMAHAYLTTRRRLMESSYQTITGQIRQMERSRRVIDRQMEQIQQMGAENIGSERIREYLQELQERYADIAAGIYCDDWGVDALLCYQGNLCRKYGIETDFYLPGFQRGNISEEDMQELLLVLLDYGIQNGKKTPDGGKRIRLHIGTVKNRLIVEYETEAGGKRRLLKKQLFPIVKKYDGTLKIETEKRDNGKMKAVIVLRAGQQENA